MEQKKKFEKLYTIISITAGLICLGIYYITNEIQTAIASIIFFIFALKGEITLTRLEILEIKKKK